MFKGSIVISPTEKHPVKGMILFGQAKHGLFVFGMSSDRGVRTIYLSHENAKVLEFLGTKNITKYEGEKDFKFDVDKMKDKMNEIVQIGISKDLRESMTWIEYLEFLKSLAEKFYFENSNNPLIN